MTSLHVHEIPNSIVAELEQRAVRSGRSVDAEIRHILEESLRRRFSKERLLDALVESPFDDRDFQPERSKDTGRAVEL